MALQVEFNSGYVSHIGRKRHQNQDAGIASNDLGLFLVADGMGGHLGGKVASELAVESVTNWVKKNQKELARNVLRSAVLSANEIIYQTALRNPDLHGMGTTITAVLFQDQTVTIAHVGDSRCYFIHGHQIWQLTEDHRLVEEKFRAKIIDRTQKNLDPMRNILTRSVGFSLELEVAVYECQLPMDGLFLVCSDGLTTHLSDHDIVHTLNQPENVTKSIQQKAQTLVDEANQRGGDDNITCLIIQQSPQKETTTSAP